MFCHNKPLFPARSGGLEKLGPISKENKKIISKALENSSQLLKRVHCCSFITYFLHFWNLSKSLCNYMSKILRSIANK